MRNRKARNRRKMAIRTITKLIAERRRSEILELIDKKCAAVNKKIIELIEEKYDLLTAKRVLSAINKELENVRKTGICELD